MIPRMLHMISDESLETAAQALRQGQLVAFPTETVYGLGADATNGKAVAAIFAAKGRPQFNPLITHVPSAREARRLGRFDRRAEILAEAFWPGPLTLILPRQENCPIHPLACAGLPSLALRVPAHPVALNLLDRAGVPVAAPSANRSGGLSPTTPAHVARSLGQEAALILAAGPCVVGLESSIVDLTGEHAVLLRPGGLPRKRIEHALGARLVDAPSLIDPDRPTAPGQLASHYATTLPLRLEAVSAESDEALLTFGPDMGIRGGCARASLSPHGDLIEAAANLFAKLHELDLCGARGIAVMPIPSEGLGEAINDRLRRSAAPR